MTRLNVLCITLVALLLAPLVSSTASAETLNISVAASLTDATNELIAQFKADGHDIQVLPNYGPSGALAKQINEGAPTHLFISANQKWMDFLREAKDIDPSTERVLVHNTLVYTGKQNAAITKIEDITQLKQIAIGSPKSVPAGEYAQQALEKVGIYQQLSDEKKLILAKDVRQALTYADRGEVDGAFVYKTDALLGKNAVILFETPQELYQPVTYPIALTVAGAKDTEAKAFYELLVGDKGKAVFEKYGFTVEK